LKVSILILTLNEQDNIKDCILSVAPLSDDILVLDSHSCDRTISIAKSQGAKVIEHKFSGWASHQNWALKNITFKYDWILYIDADERVTEELINEILNLESDVYNAFKIYRNNKFISGESLKYSMKCPGIVRLFSKHHIKYEREINPIAIVNGAVGILQSKLIHYNFSKGLNEWILKHIEYAKREAQEFNLNVSNENLHFLKKRTKKLKYFRFIFRIIYQLFFKMGILDGYAGYRYAILISFYEQLIEENMR